MRPVTRDSGLTRSARDGIKAVFGDPWAGRKTLIDERVPQNLEPLTVFLRLDGPKMCRRLGQEMSFALAAAVRGKSFVNSSENPQAAHRTG
jgi:hypothetical protein